MDIYEVAALPASQRDAMARLAEQQAADALAVRATTLVAQALLWVLEQYPEAHVVHFLGPQEPGSTAEIVRIVDGLGYALFDEDEDEDEDDAVDDLTLVQDYLTAALDDGYKFRSSSWHPAQYVLDLVRP